MNEIRIGDTVKVLDSTASSHNDGDIGQVVGINLFLDCVFYDVDVDGDVQGHYFTQLKKINR